MGAPVSTTTGAVSRPSMPRSTQNTLAAVDAGRWTPFLPNHSRGTGPAEPPHPAPRQKSTTTSDLRRSQVILDPYSEGEPEVHGGMHGRGRRGTGRRSRGAVRVLCDREARESSDPPRRKPCVIAAELKMAELEPFVGLMRFRLAGGKLDDRALVAGAEAHPRIEGSCPTAAIHQRFDMPVHFEPEAQVGGLAAQERSRTHFFGDQGKSPLKVAAGVKLLAQAITGIEPQRDHPVEVRLHAVPLDERAKGNRPAGPRSYREAPLRRRTDRGLDGCGRWFRRIWHRVRPRAGRRKENRPLEREEKDARHEEVRHSIATKGRMKFVHAADLHLDSPLRGLARYEGAPLQAIRGATRRAFENLIDLCLEEGAAFLLLAGDIFDGNWRDYSTGLFFAAQLSRLKATGIPVVLVRGNHDAESRITKH